jgi:2-oxoisovalerate dehydrogenase E1 component beta subunit
MPEITFTEATLAAMREEMRRDPMVFVIGEDMAAQGGVFGQFKGLPEEFGIDRVLDTPISETSIVGAAVGAALCGARPVVDMHFADFIACAMDEMVNQAAKARYMFGGQCNVPMVLRMPDGAINSAAAHHSQSVEAWMLHTPGVKLAVPSNPYDAKGLLISAIEDDDPVIFLEPKRLYNGPFDGHHERPVVPWSKHPLGETPDGHYTVPLGEAAVRREGADVTVVAYGTMVHVAEAAAAETGIDAEVIDLRTLVPLDVEAIERSVRKTGRCVVLHEATRTSGFGAELSAQVQERCFHHLEAPILRVTGWDTPYPHAQEWDYFPGPARVGRALEAALES